MQIYYKYRVCLFFSFLSIAVFQAFAFSGEADSPRWHFEEQRRTRDDGVEAFFKLLVADTLKIDELEFFYSIESMRRGKPNTRTDAPSPPAEGKTFYHKKVPADTRNLVIYSGRYVRLELWAAAKADGTTYITQTALNLYGQSGLDKTDFEKTDAPTILPGFNMNIGRGFYGAMTGDPVDFRMRSGAAGTARIYLDGEKIAELSPESGVYKYVLPVGRKLATRALMDHHELLFIADVFEPEYAEDTENAEEAEYASGSVQFSCCLPLYRSMRDNLDFTGGLAALFSAIALSIIAVALKGRRFLWR